MLLRSARVVSSRVRPVWAVRAASSAVPAEVRFRDVVMPPDTNPVEPVPEFPPSSLLPTVPTKITTLSNGLRVATEAYGGEMATIGVWVDAGSRFETNENNGTAHFLEHMAFKGTVKRKQAEFERTTENMGIRLNAYTTRETTTYVAQSFKQEVPAVIDILSDILQNSTFQESAIEQERQTILREMEEVDLRHSEIVFDKLHSMAFRGSSLGRSIIGPEENVRSLTRDHLITFIRNHYTTDRIVIVGAGAVDHEQLCKLVSESFNQLPQSPPEGVVPSDGGKPFFVGSAIHMREDDMDTAHIAFAQEASPWSHPDSFTLAVMVALLGAHDANTGASGLNTAGKLARVVAEDKLGHSVLPFYSPYKDTGLFGVYMECSKDKIPELTWQCQEEVTRLCYEVDEEDVRRSVNQVKANIVCNLDGSMSIAEDIGRQILTHGRRLSQKETFGRLDKITAADVKRVANTLLYDRELAVSAIGPIQFLPDYNKFRRRTYWLRY